MVYKKGTDLEKNIKIQLIYLLSKHTYIPVSYTHLTLPTKA